MGLKKAIMTNFGIDAPEAYHRIKSVRGENGGDIRYQVDVYFNEEARDLGKDPVSTNSFYIKDALSSGLSILNELYSYLKLLPEYNGATDIIEDSDEADKIIDTTLSVGFIRNGTILSNQEDLTDETQIEGANIGCDMIYGDNVFFVTLEGTNLTNLSWNGTTITSGIASGGNIADAVLKQKLI